MVFRVIDNSLTSIFNKTQTVSKGFNFASDSLNSFIRGFNRLNSEQNFGKSWEVFLKGTEALDPKLTMYFQDLAQQGASAKANIQGVYAAIIDGNTRGYGNVKSLISTFNQIDPANQKAFAQAVGQTNSRLGTYLVNLDGAKASMSGYATTLAGATAKTVALQVASLALNTALTMGVSLAISGLITLIGKCINAQKEAIEKAKETADEFANQENSLRNLREEYLKIVDSTESVSDKNKELIEWKKKLVEQYGFEEEALKKINSERETGIALIDKEIAKLARKTVNDLEKDDVAQQAMMEYYGLFDESAKANGYYGGKYQDAIRSVDFGYIASGYATKSAAEYVQNIVSDISKEIGNIEVSDLSEELGVLRQIKFGITLDTEDAQESFDKLDEFLSELKNRREGLVFQGKENEVLVIDNIINSVEKKREKIQNIIDETQTTVSSYVSSKAQLILSDYSEGLNAISNVTEENFESWRDGLLAMAGESEPLRKALENMIEDIFPQFIDQTDESTSAIKSNGTPSVKSLADTYGELGDKIKEVLDLQDKLNSAFEKVAKGEVFSSSEAFELLNQFPDLYKYMSEVEGGFTFTLDGLKELYRLQNQELISQIEENNKQNQKVIDYYNEQKGKIETLSSGNSEGEYNGSVRGFNDIQNTDLKSLEEQAGKAQESIDQANAFLGLLNTPLQEHSILMEKVQSDYDKSKSSIDEYNKQIQTIDKAIDSMNEGQALTTDELNSLLEISPALNKSVEQRADGYYIEIDALKDLRKESLDTRNSKVDDEIAKTKITLEETRARIQLYQAELASMTYASSAEKDIVIDKMWQDMELFDEIMEKIALLNGLKGEYFGGSGSSSTKDTTSDYLQNEIDYYNTIIDAIEAVTDKKIEAINKEIEGLEKQKDALEEANEERERELDLIEARNNLDKAKKQTVFVYEEGKGFVEKADEKAIADAQKEYDDIVNQIAIDDIDKQIEEQEAIKESFEDYKEQFTELSSNVEKIIAIEQAKVALGTDEEGLLNISDDQKQQIASGLAGAILAKDIDDNKDNSKYKTVTLDDVLKKFGATVTADTIPTSFKQSVSSASADRMLSSIARQNKTMTNVTYNNGSTQVSTVFNINGKLSVDDVAKAVNDEMKKVLQQFVNSVKQ